ncbi:hypothetical protein [Burkholderia sp. Bp9031]|uniref:hypothetical protein n=1 Tax=Burkholderia sp. Bp9031 TaxID=2184566 RepID=UPI00163ADCD0|nr:hypothetical protein [Burkholderia sp. Bp9031]
MTAIDEFDRTPGIGRRDGKQEEGMRTARAAGTFEPEGADALESATGDTRLFAANVEGL